MQNKISCLVNYLSQLGVKIVEQDEFIALLKRRHLQGFRVKIGITPTDVRLHLGHGLLFCIGRKLQEFGGTIIVVVADFSAGFRGIKVNKRIIERRLKEQIGRIVDMDFAKIVFQTDWTEKITLSQILSIASRCDVRQLLARPSIKSLLDSGKMLPLSDLLYFLIAPYDSVIFRSDVEIAGIDQERLLTTSRTLQRRYKRKPEIGLLAPHILGENLEKMSKSLNNCIYLSDSLEKIQKGIFKLPADSIFLAKEVEEIISKRRIGVII